VAEAEDLLASLNERYGASYAPRGRLFLRGGKLFLFSGAETRLKHVWMGLHIAGVDLSLTIEGAQLLGKTATRNCLTVGREDADRYFRGEDMAGPPGDGRVIMRTNDRIIGPGLVEGGKVRNALPKSRKTGGGV
jgi:NOL1/NOP2/fmu family ribosome biogenesis protein